MRLKSLLIAIAIHDALAMEQIQTALNAQLPAEKKQYTDMEKDWIRAEVYFRLETSKDKALNKIRKLLAECLEKQEFTKAAFLRDLRTEIMGEVAA